MMQLAIADYQESLRERVKEIQDFYARNGQCQKSGPFTVSKAIVNYLLRMQHCDAEYLLRSLLAQNHVLVVTQESVTFSPTFLGEGYCCSV